MDSLLENVMDKKFLEKVRDAYQKLSLDEKAFLSMEQLSELYSKQTQNLQKTACAQHAVKT
ncbi:MAG: hypothetical protein HFE28_01485 [Clostridia bacterium]|nr:hypothetical protein [Clostridia bacterium]